MKKEFFTLRDFDFKGKRVLIRLDINLPYDVKKKKVIETERIRKLSSLKFLMKEKAKVVILAHQGRKGREDFISLRQHARLLRKYVKIKFVNDIIGEKALEAINKLKNGEALLLDNVRFLEDETQCKNWKKCSLVKTLAPHFDFYVNDAFSVCHREHTSVVGFARVLPCIAGFELEKEIENLKKVMDVKGINTLVFGGKKADDVLKVLESILRKKPKAAENVLLGGIPALIFLKAKGLELGKSYTIIEKFGFENLIKKAKKILKKFDERIKVPIDFAIENGKRKEIGIEDLPVEKPIGDIGKRTIKEYEKIIKKSDKTIFKGAPGIFENKNFELGTKRLLRTLANSKCFSVIGGGDSLAAIEKFRIAKKKFSHISVGGGALITFLAGEKMPGLEALKISYKKFKSKL